ncbi:MAG: HEAT repeat domain-containing protein [Candidatus Binatia bacterium]
MKHESEDIASLIGSLDHSDKAVVRPAVESLIVLGPRRPEIKESLNRLLQDPHRKKLWPIAYTLAQLSAPSSRCLDVLIEGLGSEDQDIRWATFLLLTRLGKKDERITPLLLDLLKTGTATQRKIAVYCLRDMGMGDETVLERVIQTLRDPDPLVRVAAVTSLKSRAEVGKDGLDLLFHLFSEDPDSRVRCSAAITLAQLGAPTEQIRAALREASTSMDPRIKKAASSAMELLKKKEPVPPAK